MSKPLIPIIGHGQGLSLGTDVMSLILSSHKFFLHGFEDKYVVVVSTFRSRPDQCNLAECSSSNHSQRLKVCGSHLSSRFLLGQHFLSGQFASQDALLTLRQSSTGNPVSLGHSLFQFEATSRLAFLRTSKALVPGRQQFLGPLGPLLHLAIGRCRGGGVERCRLVVFHFVLMIWE